MDEDENVESSLPPTITAVYRAICAALEDDQPFADALEHARLEGFDIFVGVSYTRKNSAPAPPPAELKEPKPLVINGEVVEKFFDSNDHKLTEGWIDLDK